LIHASKGTPLATSKLGTVPDDEFTRGAIIGAATIVGVKKYSNSAEVSEDLDKHYLVGPYPKTLYGFLVKDAKRIKPIPANGSLNFFDLDIEEKQ
jgi:hypothetical protein